MLLRNNRDWRTLVWAALMPVAAGLQYARPQLIPFLAPVSFYLALAAGVIAHNHNHCPTFRDRGLNEAFGHWLSLFYGYPVFAWIPTHNLNHHKFVNRPGDVTKTWRYSNRHTLWNAATYFFVSSYFQSEPIKAFIRKARLTNRPLFRKIVLQYVVWLSVLLGSLALGLALHGRRSGLFVWLAATGGPAAFSLWTIMLFNYEQHVHADPWSDHNHSRSWTGRFLNFMLFNNGFHAAHHENAGTHWSALPAAHGRIEHLIHPALIQRSLVWYWVRMYVLAPLFPRYGSVDLSPMPPGQVPSNLALAGPIPANLGVEPLREHRIAINVAQGNS